MENVYVSTFLNFAIRLYKLILIKLLQSLTKLSDMISHAVSPFRSDLKAYILEATSIWHVQHEVSDCICDPGDGTKIKSKQFSEFGSQATWYARLTPNECILLTCLTNFLAFFKLFASQKKTAASCYDLFVMICLLCLAPVLICYYVT